MSRVCTIFFPNGACETCKWFCEIISTTEKGVLVRSCWCDYDGLFSEEFYEKDHMIGEEDEISRL